MLLNVASPAEEMDVYKVEYSLCTHLLQFKTGKREIKREIQGKGQGACKKLGNMKIYRFNFE